MSRPATGPEGEPLPVGPPEADTRPRFSLRMLIILSLGVWFMLALGLNLLWYAMVVRIERKLHFLEVADSYLFEIQQARRFEKNYFLYGGGYLKEAIVHTERALELLERNAATLAEVVGVDYFEKMLPQARRYHALLQRLEAVSHGPGAEQALARLAPAIRRQGRMTVKHATRLVTRERQAVEGMLRVAKRTPLFFLAFLLAATSYVGYLLVRRIVRPLGRFMEYTERVARGDFTPLTPTRRYRDEFTDLAAAFNRMMQELERHEKILVESHKLRAIGTLTAGIAHELNNPLNNISLTAHILKEDYHDLDEQQKLEMVDELIHETERCRRIVRDLLDFARETEARSQPLELGELVKETVRLAQNQIRLKGVKLKLDIDPNLPRVHGDRQQLSQVFLNLLLNALDASEKGGEIEISVKRASTPGFVAVEVKDHGKGIPAHILPNIFDPFFTTKSPGSSTTGGTGLGLAVSQGIVTKHGGRILVSSTEGKGSTFTVLLPVTTIPAEPFGPIREE